MRTVQRDELLDYATYGDQREGIRASVLLAKRPRRVHLGDNLTFLFENHETIRYQIQEMMRIEKIVREKDIVHELTTYNELLGGEGELGCSLLIEISDKAERIAKLQAWLDLPEHLYMKLESGEKAYAKFDPRQKGDDRLSAVQYLKFDVKGQVPVAIGSDLAEHTIEAELSDVQRNALSEDLKS